tara:strand:- start:517 stop:747 length:231 start_codon:yes stop_codon:yes gene_type:complete
MEDIEMQPITTEQKTSSLTKEEVLNQQVEQLKGTMNDNVNQVLQNIDLTFYKNIRLNIVCLCLLAGVIYYIYDSVK